MSQQFTSRARRVFFFAQEEAAFLGENYVSSEHLLLGLTREKDSGAAQLLAQMGISLGHIRGEVERQAMRGDGRLDHDMQLTPRVKRIVDLACEEAKALGKDLTGTEHLLLGMLREAKGLAGRVLHKLGADLEAARRLAGAKEGQHRGYSDVGTLGRVRPTEDRSVTEIVIDDQALAELGAVLAAKDHIGYQEMREQGRLLRVPAGVRIKCLNAPVSVKRQRTDDFLYIRLLNGEFAGRVGWIAADAFEGIEEEEAPFPPEV